MSQTTADKLAAVCYPLCDALGMMLQLDPVSLLISDAEKAEIELPVVFPGAKEMSLLITPKCIASFVSVHEAAVLVKIAKRFWVLVHYEKATGFVTLMVLDAEVLDLHEFSSFNNHRLPKMRDLFTQIAPGVKVTYQKRAHTSAQEPWIRLNGDGTNIDHPLDRGQAVEPESSRGDVSQEVPSTE